MKLSEEFILNLKSSCDIVAVASRYVNLRISGVNFRCCCPFHSEKTPSCTFYKTTQSFYCFGCGVGGDVITFVEKIENLNYVEAVQFLANLFGISMPQNVVENSSNSLRKLILKINKVAAEFFHNNLKSTLGLICLNYLKRRGVNYVYITKFGLGYSLNSWNSLSLYLQKKGFKIEEILATGLIVKSKNGNFYDKFRNRLMFPIINQHKEVVGFGGRVIDEKHNSIKIKYLNTGENEVFKKGSCLYGLNFVNIKKEVSLILCEGYFDVISMHQNGFLNAVATLGTALTNQHVNLISRMFNKVLIAFDSDVAGVKAAKRAWKMFENTNIDVKIVQLNKAKDLDEYLKMFGKNRLKLLLKSTTNYFDMIFKNFEKNFENFNSTERYKKIKQLCGLISNVFDPIKREIYLNKIVSLTGFSKNVLKAYISKISTNKFKKNNVNNFLKNKKLKMKNPIDVVENLQKKILSILICQQNSNFLNFAFKELSEEFFKTDFFKKIFCILKHNHKNGKISNFSSLSLNLNDSELGMLSLLVNTNSNVLTLQEFQNLIFMLKNEYIKTSNAISKISSQQLEQKRIKIAIIKK